MDYRQAYRIVFGADEKSSGLQPSKDALKRAYRRRARELHPDAAKTHWESERKHRAFQELQEAYSLLQSKDVASLPTSTKPIRKPAQHRPAPRAETQKAPRFGEYLIARADITQDALQQALDYQASHRPKLGTLAVASGLLNLSQLDKVTRSHKGKTTPFGHHLQETLQLSDDVLEALLERQRSYCEELGQVLIKLGLCDARTIERAWRSFEPLTSNPKHDRRAAA